MLDRNSKNRHPCLVLGLRGKDISFSPLSLILALDFSYVAFIVLMYVPSTHNFLIVFIMKVC